MTFRTPPPQHRRELEDHRNLDLFVMAALAAVAAAEEAGMAAPILMALICPAALLSARATGDHVR